MKVVKSELCIPLGPAISAMMFLGVVLFFAGEGHPDVVSRSNLLNSSLLLAAFAAIAWALNTWKPWISRWFVVTSLAITLYLNAAWLQMPELFPLAAIPTALAMALISPLAAVGVAAGQSALLLLQPELFTIQVNPTLLITTLTMVWTTVGLMAVMYGRALELVRWSWDYVEQSQQAVEEARDHKEELAQTLDSLTNANRQLLLANERMAALRTTAEEAQKAKTMFVSKVSHEFRTPLNMILGLVGLIVEKQEIGDEKVPPQFVRDLRVVHRNCQHLSSMIGDVLSLSQIDSDRLTLYRERVDLASIVESATEVIRPLLEKKTLTLRVEIPDDLPRVYCDRARIRQVILNLLSNAARFTEVGEIIVRIERREAYAIVSVTDTGPGISPEDAERIFEPFSQRADQLWRDKGGSGLGLSISQQFVKLHGGRMWLESELGAGSSFIFELPISPPIIPSGGAERWIRSDCIWRERAFRTGGGRLVDPLPEPRIVICDETGDLCAELMRHTDEVAFVDTRNLAQTLEELQRCPAHTVLVNVPSIDDFRALATELKYEAPLTPIIGCSVPRPTERALESGASGYLLKPVTPADLQAAIDQVEGPVKHVLVVDDDPDVLDLFTRMLNACDSTLEVATAISGEEALRELHSKPPDLILIDVVMPGLDGWQVLERKGRNKVIRDIPVVLVTAQDPWEQPPESQTLQVAVSDGVTPSQLLRLALELPALLAVPA